MWEAPGFLHLLLPRNYSPFFLHMVSALTSKASRETLYLTVIHVQLYSNNGKSLDEEKTTVEAANMWS